MKRFPLFFFILVLACHQKQPAIDGYYLLVAAKYGDSILSKEALAKHKTVKICKDGYWITATFFGTAKTTVESASGGTYTLKNNKCSETLNFFSQNDSMVGRTCNFDYEFKGDKYICEGTINNDKCEKCMVKEEYQKIMSDRKLRDTSLEGVWKMQMNEWFGKKTVDPDFTEVKIYAYPGTIWASYHAKGKDFIGTAGGNYHFDGKKLVESVEFFSYYDNIPFDFPVDVTKLPSGTMQQVSMDGAGKEIWKKIQ